MAFARWLDSELEDRGGCDQEALLAKYEEMRAPKHGSEIDGAKAFHSFLRGTFYRWAALWKEADKSAPEVHAVGDTHVENFGTWRDEEGRLVWGVNDFDEACVLPWTSDLVRLGVSTRLALRALKSSFIAADAACEAILDGYTKAMSGDGDAPLVLAENHETLRGFALELILAKPPEKYWDKRYKKTADAPDVVDGARAALKAALPGGAAHPEYRKPGKDEFPGMGSRGKRRFYVFAHWHGSYVLREAKAIVPSSATLAGWPSKPGLAEMLQSPRRCPDPTVQIHGKWIVRRLAPDASKIELDELAELAKEQDAAVLFTSMGAELGNLHRGSPKASAVVDDLKKRDSSGKWFLKAVEEWEERLEKDWKQFDPDKVATK